MEVPVAILAHGSHRCTHTAQVQMPPLSLSGAVANALSLTLSLFLSLSKSQPKFILFIMLLQLFGLEMSVQHPLNRGQR